MELRLGACDAYSVMADGPGNAPRFTIAFSYPSEHRQVVEPVAALLAAEFGHERILYDKYHDAEFARLDLDAYLPPLYSDHSELIVLFLCPEYASKRWCRLEWRHIKQLINTVKAERIMLLRIGDPGDLSSLGILSGDGNIDIAGLKPETVAEKIVKRLNVNRGDHGAPGPSVPPPAPIAPAQVDIDRIIRFAPETLIGREAELRILSDAWNHVVSGATNHPHVLTFVALGGEGKTSLVAKWAAELAGQGWPGCEAVFAWSFYSQGSHEQTSASSDLFLREALAFFGDAAMAGSAQGAYEKGRRLAELAAQRRTLLLLDGVEPLQYAPASPTPGELKDQGLAALLRGLAVNSHGLCVVTTRYSIADLRAFRQRAAPEVPLHRLSREAGVHLLQSLGVKGSLLRSIPSHDGREQLNPFEALIEDVKGHALTLNLLGTFLRDAHGGDIRRRDLIDLSIANAEEGSGHAFRVMDAYGQSLADKGDLGRRALALLRLLGFFDRPATIECLNALWKAPAIKGLTEPLAGLSETRRNLALKRLEDARLLTVNRDAARQLLSLDAHPLIREYFAVKLKEKHAKGWRSGHKRIYQYLRDSTREGDEPTLQDLQPLYQAVAHGCQAGLQKEACDKVYYDRIQRGSDFYGAKKLGAYSSDLGAVACFFETPWSVVSTGFSKIDQAWLLNEAAFRLRPLGRLAEALEPMRAALEGYVALTSWIESARIASNLSELELTLGAVADAVESARQSVTYVDRTPEVFVRMINRTTHADALYHAGRRADAEARFREAEPTLAEDRPNYLLLYSLRGFQYGELFPEVERTAWMRLSQKAATRNVGELAGVCRDVYKRAATTLDTVLNDSRNLLGIALNNLTLGRVALYEALLSSDASPSFSLAADHLSLAVSGLRRASAQHHIPRGLLTRAWCFFAQASEQRRRGHQGEAVESVSRAQADLDEAWDIAERGPMPLFLADIHLHRARLFWREKEYPWESPAADLTAARALIEKCGYWRRKEELEDAEAALLGAAR